MTTDGAAMISTPQQFSVLMDELASSTWTLAAIALLFESGLADHLREPRSLDEIVERCPNLSRERIERCLAVAVVRGVVTVDGGRHVLAPGVLPSLEPTQRKVLQGDYRSYLLQPAEYLRAATGPETASAWRFTDPMILQAQGAGSSMFACALKARLGLELGDLLQRLDRPGAAFLDIGVGVGALSVAMCQTFPNLRAVGLDPYDAPLALARANVTSAGLEDRIELRKILVQDLRDEEAFDLAWLPAFFLRRRDAVEHALERIRAALRPGGWVLMPSMSASAGEAQRAVWSLVMESWGGPVLPASEAESMITAVGLKARALPGPSFVSMVVGQR